MGNARICDMCGRPIEAVVMKLYMSPVVPGDKVKSRHADYTAHADVGECCVRKVMGDIRWTKRHKKSENGKVSQLRPARKGAA